MYTGCVYTLPGNLSPLQHVQWTSPWLPYTREALQQISLCMRAPFIGSVKPDPRERKTAVSMSQSQAYTHLYLILPTIPSPVAKHGEFWAYSTYIS